MSDNSYSRRGLNPNAQAFVPNPGARPFIPGQPYIYNAPQPMYSQPPPIFSMYQQMPPMVPPRFMQNTGRMPYMQQQQQLYRPPQLRQFNQQQQPPPVEAWDDDIPDGEPQASNEAEATSNGGAELGTETKETDQKGESVTGSVVDEEGDKVNKDETAKETVTKEVGAAGDKDTTEAVTNTSASEKNVDEEIAALSTKVKRSVYVDDGTRKEHVIIVFIGHVDAGKSTIGGHIMYLTGMVDKRTLEKYEKEAKDKGRESWYLSWALDTNDEEREKGKTVECGRAYFETEHKHFTILDAPGHKSFVPNMISGATQADLAVLVISARKGEFETGFDRGGQTCEHAMLVKTAGVKHLVILVNKMDDPTVNWDELRFKEIQNKLTPFLRKCGFNPKTDMYYIPVSGLTGAFLKERPSAEFGSWYTGPCLLDYLDTMLPAMSRAFDGPVRTVIADKYSDMGTIVIGKMESGVICKGDTVVVMPNRTIVQVIQLWSDEEETDKVISGDNVKIKLKGIEDVDILAGFVLCSPESLCHVGRVFDAEVLILEHKSIIASGYSCVLHIQAAIEEVVVQRVICTIDKKTGTKVKARFVKQDEKCIMRLESVEPFCLETFKDFPQMGRFMLRDEGKTIAIGKVVKIVE